MRLYERLKLAQKDTKKILALWPGTTFSTATDEDKAIFGK
jgi:hypothetical protein